MVESYVMVRARRNADGAWGPHDGDTAPYPTLGGEDVTARASQISDGPLHLSTTEAHPQIVIWRYRMSNADALAMSTDPKLWMIESRRYSTVDGEEVEQDNNKNDAYTEAERTLRIAQLANFTDFDEPMISAWWTPERTRREVALKLRDYLSKVN